MGFFDAIVDVAASVGGFVKKSPILETLGTLASIVAHAIPVVEGILDKRLKNLSVELNDSIAKLQADFKHIQYISLFGAINGCVLLLYHTQGDSKLDGYIKKS
ncbi:hypothetical protein B0I35DRAFT_410151 [Stachybotrys elegans]|uniref:Uncharacterized protein n=1 Tax=Stachybotrys elegans TaxID=80388 RepID=A0A8K0WRC4_9HYPO|nr:hypothetical protein B0I35DRAFT_410151 [Stachybotrys elegans]